MLQVKGKSLGSRKPLFADFSVPPPEGLGSGPITLRQVIESVVKFEVAAFQQRQSDRQFLRVLTQTEIEAGEAAGKIESGEAHIKPQEVDVQNAIETAVEAFEDGIYLVVVDEVEQKSLNAELELKPNSTLTFIRLTLLAGG